MPETTEVLTDYQIQNWAYNARNTGGGFLKAFAESLMKADNQNFAILRDAAIVLYNKYPNYQLPTEEF